MSILPSAILEKIRKQYSSSFDIDLYIIDPAGKRKGSPSPVGNLPLLVNTRAHALAESVRWGEPYTFFLMSSVISWVVPLVREGQILGGIIGGEVMQDDNHMDRLEAINQLTAAGSPRQTAEIAVMDMPVWDNAQSHSAAEFLFNLTCSALNWDISLLSENRKKAIRQQQIAEEIHRRKQGHNSRTLRDEERTLLSLMKAGDHKGARRELNKTLGALFSQTADIRLLKAHVIEMMGYLVRNALENSPQMSLLIEKNHDWMAVIIDTDDFEGLANAVADSLDDFMRNIYLHGQYRTNETVTRILDFLCDNYHDQITLDMISDEIGLSTFRISHLVKEQTGKTVLQHIHQLRIQEAQHLLEQSDLSCTDIAYQIGFGDQSYFIKQFRKWMGITPARYRKLYYSSEGYSET